MNDQEKALKLYNYYINYYPKYNQEHKEEIREKMKTQYYKMKADPEKWEQFKAKRRENYKNKKAQKTESETELSNG